MRLEMVKCDACGATYDAQYVLPKEWIITKTGTHYIGEEQEQHFCSQSCLITWAMQQVRGKVLPACKARRFLLVDGKTAAKTEGVLWSGGQVYLNYHSSHCLNLHCIGSFQTWEQFKEAHPSDGITWIDPEVSNVS